MYAGERLGRYWGEGVMGEALGLRIGHPPIASPEWVA